MASDYDILPNKEELDRYIYDQIPTGSFLRAILTNNLKAACASADSHNTSLIHLYVKYLYNKAPGNCWGSEEAVQKWLSTE